MATFAFLPWVAFWGHDGARVADNSVLNVGLSATEDCKSVTQHYRVTIARTNASRAKGLGGRSAPLAPGEGMLFVFDNPQRVTFWMKDTLIPLQLALFDASGVMTQTFEMPVEPDPVNPKKLYTGESQSTLLTLELAPRSLDGKLARKAYLCADSAKKP